MSLISIEGLQRDELLSLLADAEYEAAVLSQKSIVIHIGTARILAAFVIEGNTLIVELAHIDDGGEGVLLTLKNTLAVYCHQRKLHCIEWRIHAVSCAKPNLKLRAMLEKRGFTRTMVESVGEMYYKVENIC